MESILYYKGLVKITEEKLQQTLKLLKSINGGEQLFNLLPDLLERHYKEIKENEEKYNKTINMLKEEHRAIQKELQDQIDYYKMRDVEEFLSDSDYDSDSSYSSEEN